jgi:hypothetical protein
VRNSSGKHSLQWEFDGEAQQTLQLPGEVLEFKVLPAALKLLMGVQR